MIDTAIRSGATGMATMAMAIALLGKLWPLIHLAIALFPKPSFSFCVRN